MSVQTYCTRADLESLMGIQGVLACLDDDETGVDTETITGGVRTEADYVADAIERAATRINMLIRYQYGDLTVVATNAWLKWANAILARWQLRTRRMNPAESSVDAEAQEILSMLNEIRWGRMQLPDQLPSIDPRPTVSNFRPELSKVNSPIRTVKEESTGGTPGAGVKRNVAGQPGPY